MNCKAIFELTYYFIFCLFLASINQKKKKKKEKEHMSIKSIVYPDESTNDKAIKTSFNEAGTSAQKDQAVGNAPEKLRVHLECGTREADSDNSNGHSTENLAEIQDCNDESQNKVPIETQSQSSVLMSSNAGKMIGSYRIFVLKLPRQMSGFCHECIYVSRS